jgi:hypothetical protein
MVGETEGLLVGLAEGLTLTGANVVGAVVVTSSTFIFVGENDGTAVAPSFGGNVPKVGTLVAVILLFWFAFDCSNGDVARPTIKPKIANMIMAKQQILGMIEC